MTEKRLGRSVLAKLDTGVPHIARVYDYILGGRDNFAADRAAGEELIRAMPGIVVSVRENLAFLARAVRFLAAECGIRQFLDVGTGLPTANNTHAVAQSVAPACRIAYVDSDPMVLAHARAVLTSGPEGRTTYVHADLRETARVLDESREVLDFSRPVAVMLIGVLHSVPDEDDPCRIVRDLLAAVPPGSYLALSHPASDVEAEASSAALAAMNEKLPEPLTWRSRDEVARLLDGVEVLEPGLVQAPDWRPDPGGAPPAAPASTWCAVARKDMT